MAIWSTAPALRHIPLIPSRPLVDYMPGAMDNLKRRWQREFDAEASGVRLIDDEPRQRKG